MRHLIALVAVMTMMAPGASFAGKSSVKAAADPKPAEAGAALAVDEYGEEYSGDPDMVEQVAPAKRAAQKKEDVPAKIEESSVGASTGDKAKAEKGEPISAKPPAEAKPKVKEPQYSPPASLGPNAGGRAHRFRAGLVGPGIAAVSDDIGALMTAGLEGEYFFFEKLSAGLKAEAMTKFKEPTIMSFVPMARYIFDFTRFPRWSIYAQAGVGFAVVFSGGSHAAADIAIPGGGFWWQWTDRWSVGADSAVHILVRDSTAVGFTLAPAIRYLF